MIDLSKYKCPLCGNTKGNAVDFEGPDSPAYCGGCPLAIEGQGSADAWIRLSEAVHGKPHDGPTIEVRIAVAVDMDGHWWAHGSGIHTEKQAAQLVLDALNPGACLTAVTATIPVPVAQEVKGRVEE